jgi:hypothetical protein
MGMFTLDCFEKETTAIYEAIAHFFDSDISRSISLDALGHVLRRHPWFKPLSGYR